MTLENFKVYQPFGNVVLDVFLFNVDGNNSYNSCITYFLDKTGKTGLSMLTDVHAETPEECITLSLRGLGNLYSSISARCGVYNVSGDLIKEYDLNKLYPDGFNTTIPVEEDVVAALTAKPEKFYFH